MSAFLVSKQHINYLVAAALKYGVAEDAVQAASIGNALWAENHRSLSYRYNEKDPAPVYEFEASVRSVKVEPVQVLKAISCLEYQSCEHAEWEASEAKKLTNRLQECAVLALPGYDAAAWEVA